MASAADRNSYSWYSNVRMIALAGVSFLLSSPTIGSFFSWALNQLRQPRIAAQVCEIVHALSSRRVQNHKTLDERGLVIGPLAFLNGHVLLHAPRHPQGTERLHHQRNPAQGDQDLFEWLGMHFEQQTDSVGEGFGIRCMPVIVRESRILRVRIPEQTCSFVVAVFTPIHGL